MRTRTISIRGIPDATLRILRAAAKRNRRSLNAELLTVLEQAALGTGVPSAPALAVGEKGAPPYGKAHSIPAVDRAELARVCRQFQIQSLAMFGSTARGEDSPGSDVDLLAEFEPGMTPGFGIVTAADALARVFGRPVDLLTRRGLSPRLRQRVLAEAVPLYHA